MAFHPILTGPGRAKGGDMFVEIFVPETAEDIFNLFIEDRQKDHPTWAREEIIRYCGSSALAKGIADYLVESQRAKLVIENWPPTRSMIADDLVESKRAKQEPLL